MKSLSEAKKELGTKLKEGTTCPCCGQYAKIYRRKLSSAMACGLIKMYRLHKLDWFHAEDSFKTCTGLPSSIRGDFSKLRHWGLIEKREKNDDPDKKDSGYYHVTQKGADFALGFIKVPSHVLLYNTTCLGLDGNRIEILTALRNKFSYKDLMENK